MLEFSARPFLDISNNVGMLLGMLQKTNRTPSEMGGLIGQSLGELPAKCKELNLRVTSAMFAELIVDAFSGLSDEEKIGVFKQLKATGELNFKELPINTDRMVAHISTIYTTMKAELSSLQLRVIPQEKTPYILDDWLQGTV